MQYAICNIQYTVYSTLECTINQGNNIRKVNCCILCLHIEFVNKKRWINVLLVSEEDKSIAFNFDNSHDSFLIPEYFVDYLCERWIPYQVSTYIRLVLYTIMHAIYGQHQYTTY